MRFTREVAGMAAPEISKTGCDPSRVRAVYKESPCGLPGSASNTTSHDLNRLQSYPLRFARNNTKPNIFH
jgi:hypothetical protein